MADKGTLSDQIEADPELEAQDEPAGPGSEPTPLLLKEDGELAEAEAPSSRVLWANRFRYFLLGVAIVSIVGIGYLVLTRGVAAPAEVSIQTLTPTATLTPTLSSTPTNTPPPPTETPTPGPTPTPLPPFRYRVQPGDSWLGLAIRYDVGLDSVLALNGRVEDDLLKVDEEVLIPWPTYTPTPDATLIPTLEIIEVLQPEQCREHVVAAGETLYAIAAQYEMSAQLLEQVNGITNPDLIKQGQRLCIPLVTPGPPPSPTFGPSPTPEDEPQYPAPVLLYPSDGSEVPAGTQELTLQWTVVGLLTPQERYMIEVRNLSRPNFRAVRGFVNTTTWSLPADLRPAVGKIETFAWRVYVVRGEGEPASEEYRWERAGFPSDWHSFMWMGVAPLSTPTPTP